MTSEKKRELLDKARNRILQEEDADNEFSLKIIEETVFENIKCFDPVEIKKVVEYLYFKLRSRTGPLARLIEDDEVNEIMVNGPENVYVEKRGLITKSDVKFDSREELEDVIRGIAAGVHREINEMNPILDARLKDGSRVNAVYRNVALGGPVMNIRKFSKKKLTFDDLVRGNSVTGEAADFLKTLVESGFNIFISGGTSSGKTTFLNALSDFIPETERVIVIEDSAELQISRVPNLVQMETRNENAEGRGEVTMDMLIKTSLRQRPDRIIVGEVRGSEVSAMLQALNTGHSGMSTGHGNSSEGMLRRMESMYLMSGAKIPVDAIRGQITEAIDVMVHMQRLKGGERRVMEISELIDYRNEKYKMNPIFTIDFSDKKKRLKATGNSIKNNMKLRITR